MQDRIYLSPPDVGLAEEAAVLSALRSGWVAPLGPEVEAFEMELARATGRDYAVALSSGTAALHLALLGLGIGSGDVVITSTLTFAATANAITYTGAQAVFIDSDETGNMSPKLLEQALETETRMGNHVAAVLVVDLLGKVADYAAITSLADDYGVTVVSDAAESVGARRSGRAAGSFGIAACFSFNGNKIMTTSGGGMLLTDVPDLARRTAYLATQARQPALHYEHTEIGYNYRLSNLLAALGRAQFKRLPEMVSRRRYIRQYYRQLIDDFDGISILGEPHGAQSSEEDNCWLTALQVDPAVTGWTARDLMLHLAAANIESRPVWKPMHLQPVFAGSRCYHDGTSELFFERGLALPSGSVLSDPQLDAIGAHVRDFYHRRHEHDS